MRGTITADTPANLGFDHVIIAIRLPPDATNDASLLATVVHPKLGKLLIFDPTDPLTPLGRLSGALQGSYALLVAPDGGELIPTPQLPAPTSGIARTATLALEANGSIHGDVREVHVGDLAARERWRLRTAAHDVDQIKPIEAFVAHSLATFEILKAQVANARVPELPFEWRYSFDASNYAKMAGGLLLVRPRVLGVEADGLLETKDARRNAVEFDGPEHDTDTFEITLPAGYEVDELPPPTNADYRFASYHSKTELVGRVVRYTRTFEIKQLSVPLADTDDLKKFYCAISGDERRTAVLSPIAH